MSIEAARNALARAGIAPNLLRAVWIGSESHPYAVKPSSTMVAEAIGAVPHTQAADWQFACKAGTEAMVAAMGLVGSGMGRYALAIGMDTAQGRPGDALEYTAGSRRGGLHPRPGGRSPGRDRGVLLLRHRHARFLAARRAEIPGARPALHRRAGLLQAHHRRRPNPDGSHWTAGRRTTSSPSSTSPTPSSRSASPASWASSPSRSAPACSPR